MLITMSAQNDLKSLGGILIVLLVIMVIVGTIYLIAGQYQKSLCTAEDSDYVWNAGECQASSTNTTEVVIESITKTNEVKTNLGTVLGFVGILVVVAIAVMLLKMVRQFQGNKGM